jgi:hypothetical protein
MAIDATIDRRGLFSGTLAALLGGAMALRRGPAQAAETAPGPALIAAARIDGVDGGALISGESVHGFALPARAHAVVRLARGKIALIGRRPGRFSAIVDGEGDEPLRIFAPIENHRFAGHAAISPDGKTLITSEIDAQTGAGALVLRAALDGAPRTVWPMGIEPHDLLFAQDGARLVVALGGIAQNADVKGPPLNAGAIESAIVELDPSNGAVLIRHVLPPSLKSLSLRHMALAPGGETVAFGMQDQERSALRPVTGVLRVGRGLDLLPLPDGEDVGALRFYIGSVAVDPSGRYLAATSPKGGMVGLWSLAEGRWLGGFACADVCGLAADDVPGRFWATSGFGDVLHLAASSAGLAAQARWVTPAAFDNHLLRI